MPGTPAIVSTVAVPCVLVTPAMRHRTAVPLVHDDVLQSAEAEVTAGVPSEEAKARPPSVASKPPEKGALPTPTVKELTTGAGERGKGRASLRHELPALASSVKTKQDW